MSLPQLPSFTISELASILGGVAKGNADLRINGINSIEAAGEGQVTFVSSDKYAKFIAQSKASCIIINEELAVQAPSKINLIVVPDAYRAFVLAMQKFFPQVRMPEGLRHATASIDPSASVHETASIGPGCVVSEGCSVGDNVQLFANVVLYPGATVDANTTIHANVSCMAGTRIGKRCIVHSGVVLGSDGFGFLENADGSFEKIPQVGIVVVGDDVEIGANTTIDRAAVGETTIGNGVKLDNLVHIAHGVTLGENTAIAAQAGISGSTSLGKRNRIAGQVGVVGHIQTTEDVVVAAQSGVAKSIWVAGQYFGSPAKDYRIAFRIEAALKRLPDLLNEFRELQRAVEELTERKS